MRATSRGAMPESALPSEPLAAGISSMTSSGSSSVGLPMTPCVPRTRTVKPPSASRRTSRPGTFRSRSSIRPTRASASVGTNDVTAPVPVFLGWVP